MSLRRILTFALSLVLFTSVLPISANAAITTDLASGAKGSEVTELQNALVSLGYLTDAPSGYFGPATEKALRAFQANAKLSETGHVDLETRAALNSYTALKTTSVGEVKGASSLYLSQNLYYGNSGDQVRILQTMLQRLSLYTREVTGYFGNVTQGAVKAFQGSQGIEQTGGVGNRTRAALNAKFASTDTSAPTTPPTTTTTTEVSTTATGSGPAPTVSVSANPTSVNLNDNAVLSWTSTNATSCTIYGASWNQTKPANGSITLYGFTASQTYRVVCTGTGGSTTAIITIPVKTDQTPPPTVTFSANPTSVTSGGSTTVNWSTTNANYCTASGGWSGNLGTSGSRSLTPTANTTYTITCIGNAGSAAKSVAVTVATGTTEPTPTPTPGATPTVTLTASPTNVDSGGSTTLTWSSTNASSCVASGGWSGSQATSGSTTRTGLTANTTYTLECKNLTSGSQKSVTVSVTAPAVAPTVTLSANPTSVSNGGSTTLTWSSTNATSCSASGGWSGSQATSGSVSRTNLTANTTYTLSCTGAGGTSSKSASVTVAAAATPAPTVTFSANPTSIANGGSTTLSWSSTNATSCTITGTGYSTNQPTSGSVTISNLTASQTYTLTCSGAGGSANKSTTVTVAAATTGGGSTSNTGAMTFSKGGRLSVVGTNLVNSAGKPIQLRGMSTHGLQWYGWGVCVNNASLDSLRNEWGTDVIRLAMYADEDGYNTNPAKYKTMIDTIIPAVTARDMYIVLDWHMHIPGDPMANLDQAKEFFGYFSKKYAGQGNILYEIANEPNGTSVNWARIKSYAEQIIPIIRANDPDAVIIVGTPGWSSFGMSNGTGPSEVYNNPLTGANAKNVMYTFHFYATGHGTAGVNVLNEASDHLPVFVTEWGGMSTSGDGTVDPAMAQKYIDLMASKKISWTAWNLSDNYQTSGVFRTDATCPAGPFTGSNLKQWGSLVQGWVKATPRN